MERNEYLSHHGILGQKWGVRRFQNKDGSLTKAGYKRYNKDIELANIELKDAKEDYKAEAKRYNRQTIYGILYNKKANARLQKAVQKVDWQKEKIADEKAKIKVLNSIKPISKHRQKLIDGYLEKGMNKQEAEIAAYKRERTEKILAVTAGLTVAAATAFVAYKAYDKRIDRLIPAGTLLQNMSNNGNKGVQDAFYASLKSMDNTKYRGIYGHQLALNGKVYETKIGLKSGLKLASEKSATKVLEDLVKSNPQYAADLKSNIALLEGAFPTAEQNKVLSKGLKSLQNGKINSKVYEALNLALADHTLPTSDSVNNGFYNALKSKGYDAIVDINDKKYSGYRSSKPIIAFNAGAKAFVQGRREVGSDEIAKDKIKGMVDISVKSLMPSIATGMASLGLINSGRKISNTRKRNKIVSAYKKAHPDTKLSYNEILDNYYNT